MSDEKKPDPPGKIFQAMNDAMKKIEVVAKDRVNKEQGFKYRGIDDIYNAIHSAFAEAGVFCTTQVLERERSDKATKAGNIWNHILLKVTFKFYATDGSFVEVGPIFAEGLDVGDKGTNKALAGAHKVALLQMLMIPTEELKDSETTVPKDGFFANAHNQQHPPDDVPSAPDAPLEKPKLTNKPPPPNHAPASNVNKQLIVAYLKDRKISTGVFQKYLKTHLETTEVREGDVEAILELLKNEACTEGTLMAAVAAVAPGA